MRFARVIKTLQYYMGSSSKLRPIDEFRALPDVLKNGIYTEKEVLKLVKDCNINNQIIPSFSETDEANLYTAEEVVVFLNQCTMFGRHFRYTEISHNLIEHRYLNYRVSTIDDYVWLLDRAVLADPFDPVLTVNLNEETLPSDNQSINLAPLGLSILTYGAIAWAS